MKTYILRSTDLKNFLYSQEFLCYILFFIFYIIRVSYSAYLAFYTFRVLYFPHSCYTRLRLTLRLMWIMLRRDIWLWVANMLEKEAFVRRSIPRWFRVKCNSGSGSADWQISF